MTALAAALDYVERGWRVLPVKPWAKAPLTRQGVNDASADPVVVQAWWDRWPSAGVGIACGSPGPSVLDIDDPAAARDVVARLRASEIPEVATRRGSHFYFAGTDHATAKLPYGELRGRGGYVLAPPSIHPSGKEYTWLSRSEGLLAEVPVFLTAASTNAGARSLTVVPALVSYGGRHDALKELAVDLLRCRKYEPHALRVLLAAYAAGCCDPTPPIPASEIDSIVRWAVRSDIAGRERTRDQPVVMRASWRGALGDVRD